MLTSSWEVFFKQPDNGEQIKIYYTQFNIVIIYTTHYELYEKKNVLQTIVCVA